MDNTSSTNTGFTLIDKFAIGSIALIGIVFTISLASNSFILEGLANRMQGDGIMIALSDNKSFLLELVVYFTLAIGAIALLWSGSKTAWLFTCTPLIIITIYFSYSVLVTLLSVSSERNSPIEFLSTGVLMTVNFVLLLFSLTLTSKRFQEKLKS